LCLTVGGRTELHLHVGFAPAHANCVYSFFAKPGRNQWRALTEIAGGSRNLPRLTERAGNHFDAHADAHPVLGCAAKRELSPIVLLGTDGSEQERRAMVLRDQEIERAITVCIEGDDAARIMKRNLVEAGFGRYVVKALPAFVA